MLEYFPQRCFHTVQEKRRLAQMILLRRLGSVFLTLRSERGNSEQEKMHNDLQDFHGADPKTWFLTNVPLF